MWVRGTCGSAGTGAGAGAEQRVQRESAEWSSREEGVMHRAGSASQYRAGGIVLVFPMFKDVVNMKRVDAN